MGLLIGMLHLSEDSRRKVNAILFALMAVEGLIGLASLFRVRSEAGSAFLLGYSLSRLALAGLSFIAIILLVICTIECLLQPAWWRRISKQVGTILSSPSGLFVLVCILYGLFLAILSMLVLVAITAENELVTQRALVERGGFIFIWTELCILQIGVLIYLNSPLHEQSRPFLTPLRWSVLIAVTAVIYDVALYVYATSAWDIWIKGHEVIYVPVIIGLLFGLHDEFFKNSHRFAQISHYLLLILIFTSTYAIFRHTTLLAMNYFTPSKAYWHLLADAFLHGRLYLINPESTHDLTLFAGHWFVPNPPLPAFVVLPYVALFGADKINMVGVSIIIGSINAVLIYLVLSKSSDLTIIPTRRSGNLLLVILAVFGTSFWWLSIMGQMWFVAQLLTLTFTTLAVLLVLHRASPWFVGLCLGIAILSRPNAFTMWPLLIGLYLYLDGVSFTDSRQWKPVLTWSMFSAVPVCLAVIGLLYYNYIRFDNWFDFGYVDINSADWLMSAVRTYGMFNVHFLPVNLYAMFIKLPRIQAVSGCFYFSPTRDGISLLATTPAIVYVFRRIKFNWWTIGAWISILCSIGLLLFYHNTGAWQMGYRYLMDFLLPVLLLIGLGIGKRPSWVFISLVLLSILINTAGIYWWFTEWWCKPGRVL